MKKQMLTKGLAVSSALAFSVAVMAPGLASAASASPMFQANLKPLNSSGASGTLTATLNGHKLKVKEHVNGVLAGSPHAQHLHFSSKASHTCPTASVMKNNKPDDGSGDTPYGNDKVIESVEARPAYGPPVVSLTTSGDTSGDSALALKRFPTAKNGKIDYTRTVNLNDKQVKHLKAGELVAVVHGLDLNGNGKYDVFGSNKNLTKSALADLAGVSDSFPLEGTAPASCGVLTAMPSGAPETGSGSTAGLENGDLFAIGGAAIVAAGATLALRKRATAANRQ
jgi:hypothetical protein